MAAVYRARHVTLDSLHAVKILFITAPSIRQRLLREGRVQANLRHPNIVAVTDVLEVMGAPALVMEYVDGPALDTWLSEHKPTLDEALFLFRGILRGMMAAHERGVIHRDLKPANVMLSPTNEGVVPKVTDFGLVKSLGDQSGKTQTGMAMGTPEYMAPEQIRDASNVDQRVDLFALGCILYELVCHRRAFAGPDNVSVFNAIVAGTYPPPRKFVEDLPRNVHEAIRWLLEPDPEKRLPTCVELFDLLYEEQTVGRLGSMKAQLTPIHISGTLPDLAASMSAREQPHANRPTLSPRSDAGPDTEIRPSTQTTSPDLYDQARGTPEPVPPRPGVSPLGRILPIGVTLLIAGTAVGGAFWFAGSGGADQNPTIADALQPRIQVEPAAQGQDASGSAPVAAGSGEETQAPEPAPPAPPQPVAPQPAPVAPKPAPVAPKPAPVAPKPAPVAPKPAPSGATLKVTGDARAVWLMVDGVKVSATGPIPPGTHRILADFGGPEPAAAGSVTLRQGQTVTLECSSFLYQCRPK